MSERLTTPRWPPRWRRSAAPRKTRARGVARRLDRDQETPPCAKPPRRIRANTRAILAANAQDMDAARAAALAPAMLDRLQLSESRIDAMAHGLEEIAALPDPVGRELARWTRPNGLDIARIATPIGVIGIIYESRPNVTADAGALCLKSGNAAILRGGSESVQSSHAIHAALAEGLKAAGLPATAIQLVPTTDRAAVGLMLEGLGGTIDLIIPRGGKGADRPRHGRSARAGARPSRRHRAYLCPWKGRSGKGARDRRSTPRCAAPGFAAPPRRC